MEGTNKLLSMANLKEGSMTMVFLHPTSKKIKSPVDYKVKEFKINMKDFPAMDKIEFHKKGNEWIYHKLLIHMLLLRNGLPIWISKPKMQMMQLK